MIRNKNNVPQVYVSESRDFQLFTRLLDFVHNSVKYDIDSITDIIDTKVMSSHYLDRLKYKVGFMTSNIYDDDTMRIVLSAFPHILKYKGSEEGIQRCVYTFLNCIGIKNRCTINIYNDNDDESLKYKVRIGIDSNVTDITLLKDLLRYVMPTGYLLEIYFYRGADESNLITQFDSSALAVRDTMNISALRADTIPNLQEQVVKVSNISGDTTCYQKDMYNMVQLSSVYEPVATINEEDEVNE